MNGTQQQQELSVSSSSLESDSEIERRGRSAWNPKTTGELLVGQVFPIQVLLVMKRFLCAREELYSVVVVGIGRERESGR